MGNKTIALTSVCLFVMAGCADFENSSAEQPQATQAAVAEVAEVAVKPAVVAEVPVEAPKPVASEKVIDLSAESWLNWKDDQCLYKADEKALELSGKSVSLFSKEMYEIKPGERTVLSGTFENLSAKDKAQVILGFRLFDKDKKEIKPQHVQAIAGSGTVLTRNCRAGANVIYVQDASGWKVDGNVFPVFEVADDCSDLPNYNCKYSAGQTIRQITKLGDNGYAVEFTEPIGLEYPKNTTVRLHSKNGYYMYTGGTDWLAPGEVVDLGGIAQDILSQGTAHDQWWPGAEFAQVCVLLRGVSGDAKVLARNIAVDGF